MITAGGRKTWVGSMPTALSWDYRRMRPGLESCLTFFLFFFVSGQGVIGVKTLLSFLGA
jgi:hypothetical protein